MKKRGSAKDRMEELLEFIRHKGNITEEEAVAFCSQKFGLAPQTTFNYLSALERAGLIRVSPNGITPWKTDQSTGTDKRSLKRYRQGQTQAQQNLLAF
ncbi:MAG: hypothetical protein ACP5GO_01610 [Thermoprotei archaeon]|jgi:Mn-dependent DtxR family transcriptional regulator